MLIGRAFESPRALDEGVEGEFEDSTPDASSFVLEAWGVKRSVLPEERATLSLEGEDRGPSVVGDRGPPHCDMNERTSTLDQ